MLHFELASTTLLRATLSSLFNQITMMISSENPYQVVQYPQLSSASLPEAVRDSSVLSRFLFYIVSSEEGIGGL